MEISPATYFRLNSLGAEELCKVVADLADVNENTTVLDLFCGSGCLALTLAEVIGFITNVFFKNNCIYMKRYLILFIYNKLIILCNLSSKNIFILSAQIGKI